MHVYGPESHMTAVVSMALGLKELEPEVQQAATMSASDAAPASTPAPDVTATPAAPAEVGFGFSFCVV